MGFENGRTKQIAGCWGIAKVFMPKCCEDVETPEDTDPYALFHMILNCGLFPLTHQHVESVIKARNDMMHSRTNTLSDGDTRTYINAMKDFLQDASSKVTGNNSSTVRDALDKARREIDELLLGEMNIDILSKEAKRALIFKKDYISKSVRVITSSGGNAQELREYLDILEKLGGELQFWNRHPWEIRKMSELNDIRNQLEIANQENEQLKEDLKKAQIDLKDVQQANIDIAQFQKELDEVQVKLNEVSMENQIKKPNYRIFKMS
ncbi:uncharacterized protein LOC128554264 [Mercenaria mercenaria]|uniref:uncharacterized protein LOC128554264 n=1 Tax=Mercenaria mercenaria TaxID=6596 RepID=UPI00234F6D5B|nr:uncharacterized protein LOC128554264 [Mercenaria mercenaria]